MKIYNTTTETVIDLSIINRPTNTEWTQDLIGNTGGLNYNIDAERHEMTQDEIDWWSTIIDGLNNIEDLTEKAKELLSADDFENLEHKLSIAGNGDDYEQHISILTPMLLDAIYNDNMPVN